MQKQRSPNNNDSDGAQNRQPYEQSFYGLNAIDGPSSRLQTQSPAPAPVPVPFSVSVSACLTAADGQGTTDSGQRTTDNEQRTQIDGSPH